ncbi:OmpA family protein [Mesobacterium sp. TK19101]|uniref:OmpA family protein n=1 Tax=Mesobacterium hydrothermale TaxID=3111907 RepID=A0ABU6HCY5_9RHOB|nr:OmpA family protein [Mesobacterium sp. TK19101]MEC3860328.1 OmpA family protein [Mesobacterium sp. TK19101]
MAYFSKAVRAGIGAALIALTAALPVAAQDLSGPGSSGSSQKFSRNTPSQQGRDRGQYIPGIALTPDGCEVWVMDDGAEGYGDNRLTRQGMPICHDVEPCGLLNTDQFFATDSYRIKSQHQSRIAQFFRSSTAFAFVVVGHTDSRASDDYNMRLSYNRALAVAKIGKSVGARITDVRGMGERFPVATNATKEGMARNRRVEILCFE